MTVKPQNINRIFSAETSNIEVNLSKARKKKFRKENAHNFLCPSARLIYGKLNESYV